jgi:nitroimidazol reductase NimA-like FMN-containing flavoprotein (pyridoxamine 5'-phosphate oxidase superfamily)
MKPRHADQLWTPKVATVLARASIAYLAVQASRGPHVTPLLFAATPDRLWFGIGRGTLKARVVAKRPAVSVVVPGANASVAVCGEARLLDRLTVAPAELARAPFALPAFASQNPLEITAFARDLARRDAPAQPLALVSVRVETVHVLDGWPASAVLGWAAPGGPLALPAKWDARSERAHVPALLLQRAGGPRVAPACVCVDESEGRGPLAKRGTLLRGQGRARLRGDVASIALEPDRVTRWRGFKTTTADVSARPR